MTEKFIPLIDVRQRQTSLAIPTKLNAPQGSLTDSLSRPLHDMRISVIDRCNFRCVYCMPKEIFDKNYQYLPHDSLLSFEEITRVAGIFLSHGVKKIRLTGGEPLLRKNIESLIAMLSDLRTVNDLPPDLTLTTNGSLLSKKATLLKAAGLNRLTVSLDSLDDAIFKRMNDVDFAVSDVLHGIDAAHAAGLGPIKINMVVKAGVNDHEVVTMARYFKHTPYILRFIEYMDVGASNGGNMEEVIPSAEVVKRINSEMPLEAINPNYTGETAARWRYVDGGGEVGMISSVTQSFCKDCTRARLSTEGQLYTCLFATRGHDLRGLLRAGRSDAEIAGAVAHLWRARADRYSDTRTQNTSGIRDGAKRVEMSYIGG